MVKIIKFNKAHTHTHTHTHRWEEVWLSFRHIFRGNGGGDYLIFSAFGDVYEN